MPGQSPKSPEVFVSYSSDDQKFKDDLLKQLRVLAKQGAISIWHDGLLVPGHQWKTEIIEHLKSSRVILLLISPEFLDSDYVNEVELTAAAARHKRHEVCVIPVLVRNVNAWQGYPFGDLTLGDLQAVPSGEKFIVEWDNRAKAFADVANGIQRAIEQLNADPPAHHNLLIPPPPMVDFVARQGRDGGYIVERVKEELTRPNKRLIALSGEGGVGKTTIAAEVARSLMDKFSGRIVWASAEKRADFTLSTILDEIAIQLGDPSPMTLAIEQKENVVCELIAEAPALIVLDNFETVSPAEQSACVSFLRERVPCSSLITSRQQIPSTPNIRVDGMTPEEAEEFLGKLIFQMQDPLIFSDSVRQQIIETAEARPYVMEWVVAQIDQRAEVPYTVLKELSRGEGDAAERIFDHLFNLVQLGDDGRAALLALSLFVPSASREALSVVAGFGDNEHRLNDAITKLRALLLVKGVDENRRLTVEGLTRSLAKSRLAKDPQASEYRERFTTYFAKLAEAYQQTKPANFELFDAEKENTLKAMDVAFETHAWTLIVDIHSVLAEFLNVHGYWDDALRSGRQALEAAREVKQEGTVATFSHDLATIHQQRGDNEEALRLYNSSLEIKNKTGDLGGIAKTLHNLAVMALDRGQLNEARRLYDQSLEIEKSLGNQSGIAVTLHELGRLAMAQKELKEAHRLYAESLEIQKKLGNQSGIGITLHELGRLAQAENKLEDAKQLYRESLEIKRKVGELSGIAGSLHQLGTIAQTQGHLDEARRLYTESLEIERKLGNQNGLAISLDTLGELAAEAGDSLEATRLFSEALVIFERLKSPNAEITHRNLERVRGESS